MRIHHVGIICKNIEKSVNDYSKYFNVVNRTDIIYDPLQDASLCLLETDNGLNVEFISGGQVANLPKGMTYYHVCYQVDNLDISISGFENQGALLVSPPKPAILFGNKRVAFLIIKSGLIELLEI